MTLAGCMILIGALGALLPSTSTAAQPRSGPEAVAMATGPLPEILAITNPATGQVIVPPARGPWPPPQPRGQTVAFDILSNPGSSTGLNVAYENPGSYDGSNPSTRAFMIGLAEVQRYVAPRDIDAGFPAPTDIVWNDYRSDPGAWPGPPGSTATLLRFECVVVLRNNEPPAPLPRTDTLRVEFFSADGLASHGAFTVTFSVPPGYNAWGAESIDLAQLDPPILVPRDGLVMLDFTEPGNSGVGTLLAGGDLVNPEVPRPETLWTAGATDVMSWFFSDGVTGAAGPPSHADPAFDGDPSSTSYLDLLNTGALANWQFTAGGNPPLFVLAHDFPCRIIVAGAPQCACDINDSGALNSQDFFDFLGAFFAGQADFNNSGQTNSQDFFDFLACFFSGC